MLEFSEHDWLGIQQVRLLETLALQLARANVTQADLTELRQTTDRMVNAYEQQNYVECTQANLEFHSLVWDGTGNERLYSTLRNIAVPYFVYGSAFRMSRPDLTGALLRSQHKSFIAYLSGTPDQTAEQCVRSHLGL